MPRQRDCIEDPAVLVKILAHLGLPTRAPLRASARIDECFQTASSHSAFRFSSRPGTPHSPRFPSHPPQGIARRRHTLGTRATQARLAGGTPLIVDH